MNISSIARKPFYDKFFLKPTMPGFLRLALSDSLSFDPSHKSGGAINNFNDHHFAKLKINSGLKKFLKDVVELHEKGNHITTMLSKADLIQIAGASSVEYCGGPKINIK